MVEIEKVKVDELSARLKAQSLCVVWTDWPRSAPRPELHTANVSVYSDEVRQGEVQITPKLATKPTQCSSCQAPIMFVDTVNGRKLPLSLKTIRQDTAGRMFALSHWVVCPTRDQHRRKR